MEKIKVTAQQRANAIEARDVMWPSVPPENVYPGLGAWRRGAIARRPHCGTVACFGGWCAWWPEFRAQGVRSNKFDGAPEIEEFDSPRDVSERLFGDRGMFFARGCNEKTDRGFSSIASDHALVTRRLNWLIENSEVVE